jgi:hypothetical protein
MGWRTVYYLLLAALGASALASSYSFGISTFVLVNGILLAVVIYGLKSVAWLYRVRPASPLGSLKSVDYLPPLDRTALFVSSSFFGIFLPPLKMSIPKWQGFWADAPLASFERSVLGQDAWQLAHAILPPKLFMPLVDKIYSVWILALIAGCAIVAFAAPDRVVARFFLSWSIIWTLLAVVAATALASAGPIYGPLLDFGFEELRLKAAPITTFYRDLLWQAYVNDDPRFGGGISAAPSIHCAVAFLFVLAARNTLLFWPAIIYAGVIWFSSVYLGWHYAVDGAMSLIAVILIWKLTAVIPYRGGPHPNSLQSPTYAPDTPPPFPGRLKR